MSEKILCDMVNTKITTNKHPYFKDGTETTTNDSR